MIKLNQKNHSNKNDTTNNDETDKIKNQSDNTLLDYVDLLMKNKFEKIDFISLNNTLNNLKFSSQNDFDDLKAFAILLLKEFKENKSYSSDIKAKIIKSEPKTIQFNLPSIFSSISKLLEEVIDDNHEIAYKIIPIIENYLIEIEHLLVDANIEKVYAESSILMSKLCNYDFPQRKYIYKVLAEIFSKTLISYRFISPEDINHVDNEIHKVIEGKSLRISCGLSFVLLNKQSNSVIEYANVKTY